MSDRLRHLNLSLIGLMTLTLCACEPPEEFPPGEKQEVISPTQQAISTEKSPNQSVKQENSSPEIPPDSTFKTIEWTDLIPKEDLEALLNPPAYVTEIEDGSLEDQINSQIQNTFAAASDDRYQQALVSTRIVPEMDGKAIRLPGFIVPLEFNDIQVITQFFLVPFFGACIHLPPPPPNQIIFVSYPKGLKLKNFYDPYWISGILKTSVTENDMTIAAYTMQMHSFEVYTEDNEYSEE